jgi:hypothetical protein
MNPLLVGWILQKLQQQVHLLITENCEFEHVNANDMITTAFSILTPVKIHISRHQESGHQQSPINVFDHSS